MFSLYIYCEKIRLEFIPENKQDVEREGQGRAAHLAIAQKKERKKKSFEFLKNFMQILKFSIMVFKYRNWTFQLILYHLIEYGH